MQTDSIIRKKELLRRIGLSDATVWRMERAEFPPPLAPWRKLNRLACFGGRSMDRRKSGGASLQMTELIKGAATDPELWARLSEQYGYSLIPLRGQGRVRTRVAALVPWE